MAPITQRRLAERSAILSVAPATARLEYRRGSCPDTANRYVLISRISALGTERDGHANAASNLLSGPAEQPLLPGTGSKHRSGGRDVSHHAGPGPGAHCLLLLCQGPGSV